MLNVVVFWFTVVLVNVIDVDVTVDACGLTTAPNSTLLSSGVQRNANIPDVVVYALPLDRDGPSEKNVNRGPNRIF